MGKRRVEPGMTFGRLRVIQRVPDPTRNARWECLCECGATHFAYSPNLLSGRVTSCGCWRRQQWMNRRKERVLLNGYILLRMPDHPRANMYTGRVREHIVVMEQMLGRSLHPGEHHLNADRADNRPENLELWNRSHHPTGARVSDQVAWAQEILRRYAPEKLMIP